VITVKDWMSKPVITAKTEDTVFDVVKTMAKHDIGSIIITADGKKPEGIITERDVIKKVIATGKDPKSTRAKDIMTGKVLTVDVKTSLLEISNLMTKNMMRRMVVVEKGNMIGIVTSRDLVQLMAG
jgi:CBS domain-containing protein